MTAVSDGYHTRLESNAKTVDSKSSCSSSICQTHIFSANDTVNTLREFWLENLPKIESNPNKLQRHADCCKHGWIVRNKHTGELRIRYNACGLRFCPHCIKSFQVQTREKLLSVISGQQDLKFITLTLQANEAPLSEQLEHLKNSFRRLRQQKFWKVEKGYAVVEITYNLQTDAWHPHLHIICVSKYIPKETLSKAWLKASKGSYIVDVRAIKDQKHATNYLTSYLAKMDSKDSKGRLKILSWPLHRLKEFYQSMHYRRLVLKFGAWPSISEDQEDPIAADPEAWEVVSSIEELFALLPNQKAAEILNNFGYGYIINTTKGNSS